LKIIDQKSGNKLIKLLKNEWLNRWMFATNHKDIGTLYLILGVWAGLVGSGLSFIIRFGLSQPGRVINPKIFKMVITAHGLIMIFFLWCLY